MNTKVRVEVPSAEPVGVIAEEVREEGRNKTERELGNGEDGDGSEGREGTKQEEGALTEGVGEGNGGDGRDGKDGMEGMEGRGKANLLRVKVPIKTDARQLTGNVGRPKEKSI